MTGRQPRTGAAAALEQLEQAARAPGAQVALKLRWGWALYGAGRFGEAIEVARGVEAQGAESAEVSYLLGIALKASGDQEGAARAFRRAAMEAQGLSDAVRGAMLRRLAVGQANWIERGEWDLEPETWVRA